MSTHNICFFGELQKIILQIEFVFYVKTDPPYWSDAVLYRKSGFGTAKGYKLRK